MDLKSLKVSEVSQPAIEYLTTDRAAEDYDISALECAFTELAKDIEHIKKDLPEEERIAISQTIALALIAKRDTLRPKLSLRPRTPAETSGGILITKKEGLS